MDVPNKTGQLLPGGFAQVSVKASGQRLRVPINALLFRSEGLRAVVIDSEQKARLRPLVVGRDYGTTLEVIGGLNASGGSCLILLTLWKMAKPFSRQTGEQSK